MSIRFSLLKHVGRALVKHVGNAVGFGCLGNILLEIGDEVWKQWNKEKNEAQRREELQALAQAVGRECREQVAEVVREVAAGQPDEVRRAVEGYLNQVPGRVRRSLSRPADPSGKTVPPGLVMRRAEDLLPFLPEQLPRFHPGDRPLPGVDWELVELLGAGGFGEVWKAKNPHFDGVPPVALKFCLDPAARDKLLRHEAAVLNQLMRQGTHPGIVQLRHTYLSADPPCLEYEYVEGGDLAGLIREGQQAPPDQAARVVLELARIVGFAHRLQPPIVHRDLKPANILLEKRKTTKYTKYTKKEEEPISPFSCISCISWFDFKITDFGIGGLAAGHAIAERTHSPGGGQFFVTAVRGAYTPLYASPQQVGGGPPDPRDDVHALGVIWYQLLTGDLTAGPPGGLQWPERLRQRGMSEAMIRLLASCFETRAEDRPADAAVLAEALARLLEPKGSAEEAEVRRLVGHTGAVTGVAISPDGRLALSGGLDGTVRQWDVETGREVRRFVGHTAGVAAVAFSPDGQQALSGGEDQTVRLWDVATGRELHCLRGHTATVRYVAFAPDGRLLLTGGGSLDETGQPRDGGVRLWECATGEQLRRFEGSGFPVCQAVFLPNGRHVLSGEWNHQLRLWDAVTGQELRRFARHEGPVWCVAVSADGRRALSGSTDGIVHLWEVASGRELLRLEGHTDWVQAVAFSADGCWALSGSEDRTVRLWETTTGKQVGLFRGHTGGVTSVALSPDGRYALSGGKDGTVRLWR